MSNKPSVGLLVSQFGQRKLKMAKISYFSNEIHFGEALEILDVDNQTVTSCGQDEHHRSPKNVYFSGVIGLYLMSFFYDHPV